MSKETENLKIKEIRKMLKLTQQQLADSIDVSKQYLSRVENNLTDLSKEKIILLCDNYGISLDWLLSDYGQMFHGDQDYTERLFCGKGDRKHFVNLIDIYNLYIKKVLEIVDTKYPEAELEDKIKTAQFLYMQDCLNNHFSISQVDAIKKKFYEDKFFSDDFKNKILGTYYFISVNDDLKTE